MNFESLDCGLHHVQSEFILVTISWFRNLINSGWRKCRRNGPSSALSRNYAQLLIALQIFQVANHRTQTRKGPPVTLSLSLNQATSVPVEVEGIIPSVVRDKTLGEIEKLAVFCGNHKVPLADFFQVTGNADDQTIVWSGNLTGVHWIGAKMKTGRVVVEGNGGRHIGSEMSGGEIQVHGNTSDWVGGEMHGGLIHVHGNAGHLVGAAYRGSHHGMTRGTILIDGSVGNEIGHTMRRGLISVGGSADDLVGFNMLAGTIFVFGDVGIRHGAGMRRGTIGLWSENAPTLLPSFRRACRTRPLAIDLVFENLRQKGFEIPARLSSCQFDLYNGDLIEGGRGEILLTAI